MGENLEKTSNHKIHPLIEIKNLYKFYKMGNEIVKALNGVDLVINKGEIVCLLGPSGSGKSTLLNAIAGLERPTKGEIIIGGIHLENLNETQITTFRSLNVGFVFQTYNLIPTLTALENVSLGLMLKGINKTQRDKYAKEALDIVGLNDRYNHKPSEMSGGQQQRVAIARAFVSNPKLLFADEPTGNLDTKTSFEVMSLITKIVRKNNQTLIIVTHDEEITEFADKVFYMRDGVIERKHHKSIISTEKGVILQ